MNLDDKKGQNMSHKANITLLPRSDKGIKRKENHRASSFMNTDANILNKILVNQTKIYIKKL